MAKVHKVGEPDSEALRLTIGMLKDKLPDDYIIFHNLETISPAGFAYEIDLLVIAPHAVFVIEEKNYTGHIRGNAREWKMFNGAVFPSPLPSINRKTRIVATQLKTFDPSLEKVYCHALVHLSSAKAKLKIYDPQVGQITVGEQLVRYLTTPARLPVPDCDTTRLREKICGAVLAGFEPAQPERQIGPYDIIEQLHSTPEYTEYLAEHRYLEIESRTRLKVYHVDIYQSAEKRERQLRLIFRDMHAIKKLASHPNIVRASDIFPGGNDTFVLPTEWVDGYSLRGLYSTGNKPERGNLADIFRQICTGLVYAHQHGVIHRDLRPENIIVCDNGTVKLINFDFARIADIRIETIATQIEGQLDQRYTAPEVLASPAAASERSDLYSVGIMFYEALVGQTPYRSPRELLSHREFDWSVTADCTDDPAGTNELLRALCSFSPESRLASAGQAAAAFSSLRQ